MDLLLGLRSRGGSDFFGAARVERARVDCERRTFYVDVVPAAARSGSSSSALMREERLMSDRSSSAAAPLSPLTFARGSALMRILHRTALELAPRSLCDALNPAAAAAAAPLRLELTPTAAAGAGAAAAAKSCRCPLPVAMIAIAPPRLLPLSSSSDTHTARWHRELLGHLDTPVVQAPSPPPRCGQRLERLALRRVPLNEGVAAWLPPMRAAYKKAPWLVDATEHRVTLRLLDEKGGAHRLAAGQQSTRAAARVLTKELGSSMDFTESASHATTIAVAVDAAIVNRGAALLVVTGLKRSRSSSATPAAAEPAPAFFAAARSPSGGVREMALLPESDGMDTCTTARKLGALATKRAAALVVRSLRASVAIARGSNVAAAARRSLRSARRPPGLVSWHSGQGSLCLLPVFCSSSRASSLQRAGSFLRTPMRAISSIDVEPIECSRDRSRIDLIAQLHVASGRGANTTSNCAAAGLRFAVLAPGSAAVARTSDADPYGSAKVALANASRAAAVVPPHERLLHSLPALKVPPPRAASPPQAAAEERNSATAHAPLDRVELFLQLQRQHGAQRQLPPRPTSAAAATATATALPPPIPVTTHATTSLVLGEGGRAAKCIERSARGLIDACATTTALTARVMAQVAVAEGSAALPGGPAAFSPHQRAALEIRLHVVVQEMLASPGESDAALRSRLLALHALTKALGTLEAEGAEAAAETLHSTLESTKYMQLLAPAEQTALRTAVEGIERIRSELMVVPIFASEPFIQRFKLVCALRRERIECYDRTLRYPVSLIIDERSAVCVITRAALASLEPGGHMPVIAALFALEGRFERIAVIIDAYSPQRTAPGAQAGVPDAAIAVLLARRRRATFAVSHAFSGEDVAREISASVRSSVGRAHDAHDAASRWPRATEYHRRAWLIEEESSAESLLSAFPSLNPFCAAAILTQMPVREFLACSAAEKKTRLPWLSARALDEAHAVACE